MTDYAHDAREDAKETVLEFIDQVVEQLEGAGEASNDLLNNYPNGDSWHHECHVDKSYTLMEAADLLDQLSEYEEDDCGLWEGQLPVQAIGIQAAYTYGNAVYSAWIELIEKINSEYSELDSDFDSGLDEVVWAWVADF